MNYCSTCGRSLKYIRPQTRAQRLEAKRERIAIELAKEQALDKLISINKFFEKCEYEDQLIETMNTLNRDLELLE
jgi:hypothetical protein